MNNNTNNLFGCELLKVQYDYIVDEAYEKYKILNDFIINDVANIIISFLTYECGYTIEKINNYSYLNMMISDFEYKVEYFYELLKTKKIHVYYYHFEDERVNMYVLKLQIADYIIPQVIPFRLCIKADNTDEILNTFNNATAEHILHTFFDKKKYKINENMIRLFKKRLLIILDGMLSNDNPITTKN